MKNWQYLLLVAWVSTCAGTLWAISSKLTEIIKLLSD